MCVAAGAVSYGPWVFNSGAPYPSLLIMASARVRPIATDMCGLTVLKFAQAVNAFAGVGHLPLLRD